MLDQIVVDGAVRELRPDFLRRPELPRINRVVDAYNLISVRHELPIGGEDPAALLRWISPDVVTSTRLLAP